MDFPPRACSGGSEDEDNFGQFLNIVVEMRPPRRKAHMISAPSPALDETGSVQ